MNTPTLSAPPPRRRWPWILLALCLAFIATFVWRDYMEKQALRQLEEAGLTLPKWNSMWVRARSDWHDLFRLVAWKGSYERRVLKQEGDSATAKMRQLRNFDALASTLRRLNPDTIEIHYPGLPALENVDGLQGITTLSRIHFDSCSSLRNLEGFRGLPNLKNLGLLHCPALQNLDGLAGLTGLETLSLIECRELHNADAFRRLISLKVLCLDTCPALENLDGLKGLTKLENIEFIYCPKLSPEAIAALQAALPNTKIEVH